MHKTKTQQEEEHDTQLAREYREWNTDRITIRTNDGTNQCQPANAWMKIIDRIHNRNLAFAATK